jgi:membrane-associated phospholipid phosphatase
MTNPTLQGVQSLDRKKIWLISATFVAFSGAVALGWLQKADAEVWVLCQKCSSLFVDVLLSCFSLLGSIEFAGTGLLVLLAMLFLQGHQALAGRFLAVFIAMSLLEFAIKCYLPHEQPPEGVVHTQYFVPSDNITTADIVTNTYSYPSGHMLRGVIILGALYCLSGSKFQRAGVMLALLGLGAARVYFDAHWASDVVGGALLGVIALVWAFGGKTKLKASTDSVYEHGALISRPD